MYTPYVELFAKYCANAVVAKAVFDVPAAIVVPTTGKLKVAPVNVGEAVVCKSCDVLTAKLLAVVATAVRPLLLVKLIDPLEGLIVPVVPTTKLTALFAFVKAELAYCEAPAALLVAVFACVYA